MESNKPVHKRGPGLNNLAQRLKERLHFMTLSAKFEEKSHCHARRSQRAKSRRDGESGLLREWLTWEKNLQIPIEIKPSHAKLQCLERHAKNKKS